MPPSTNGNKKKPTAVLKAEGKYQKAWHGDRTHEPQPGGEPKPTGKLDWHGKQLWGRVVPMLVSLGIATQADSDALSDLCRWYSLYRKASDKGDVNKATAAYKQVKMLYEIFGLPPGGRAGLSITSGATTLDRFRSPSGPPQ